MQKVSLLTSFEQLEDVTTLGSHSHLARHWLGGAQEQLFLRPTSSLNPYYLTCGCYLNFGPLDICKPSSNLLPCINPKWFLQWFLKIKFKDNRNKFSQIL